jgi:tRNA-uridine aminocarboxypropyltransferase
MRGHNLPLCPCCGLPAPVCPGLDTPRLETRVPVVIVVHRLELQKTSNTARLVKRVLSRCELRIRGDRDQLPPPIPWARKLLLFPVEGARPLEPGDALVEGTVLVVPDGTWGQARRMVRRDPLLIDAEPVALPPGEPSRYRLRRDLGDGTLSTCEAVSRALGVLEGAGAEKALLDVFDRFVGRMLAVRGAMT